MEEFLMRKTLLNCLLVLVFALGLCACSAPAGDGSGRDPGASPSGLDQTEPAGLDQSDPSAGPEQADPPSDVGQSDPASSLEQADPPAGISPSGSPQPQDPARAAFRAALQRIYDEQVLPNGDPLDMADYSDITKAQFAVFDLDQDGKEELIFTFSDTYMAGMATYVYGYDAEIDRLLVEIWEFPALSFYNTGIVEAQASHNQGPAGDALWPFILYQYEPMTDDYRKVAVVDAWDRSFAGDTTLSSTEDGMVEISFPEQADADGDGVVYYIMSDGYVLENPIDGAEFREWYDSWFEGTEKIEIPYVYLTPENIRSIE